MFIDVQANLLFFVVAAWEDDFTGYVVDYGAYPDQKRPYFTLRDARHTLAVATKASGLEGSIYAGLETLTGDYLGREWRRDDGAMLRIERCLIDANWGSSTDVVYQFCRQSAARRRRHAQPRSVRRRVQPAVLGVQAQARRPRRAQLADAQRAWQASRAARGLRHQLLEVVRPRPAGVAMGDRGCLSLFGDSPDQHRLFAEHLIGRVPREDRRPRPHGGRMEDASRAWRQPLVRLPGRLRRGRVDARRACLPAPTGRSTSHA